MQAPELPAGAAGESVPPQGNGTQESKSFLMKLKEYKEVITVVVFFLGGFLWIQMYYATKMEHRVLGCKVHWHVAALRASKDLQETARERGKIDAMMEIMASQMRLPRSEFIYFAQLASDPKLSHLEQAHLSPGFDRVYRDDPNFVLQNFIKARTMLEDSAKLDSKEAKDQEILDEAEDNIMTLHCENGGS